jgi:hypothetical protein
MQQEFDDECTVDIVISVSTLLWWVWT